MSDAQGPFLESPHENLHVVLFSGGTGTDSITSALLKGPQVDLTIVVNAYDDGHSSGRLRRFIPGMLGPSDVRKNINRLMPTGEPCYEALRRLSERRLPARSDYADAIRVVRGLADGNAADLPADILSDYLDLCTRQTLALNSYLQTFLSYTAERQAGGCLFDFSDCAIGNLFFSGCYLQHGCDFNRAVEAIANVHDVRAKLLNVTAGENLFLLARLEDGTLLRTEAEIVSRRGASRISSIFLVAPEKFPRIEAGPAMAMDPAMFPEPNPHALQAIAEADVVIYGPGTQHSSLFPSYLTRGVAETIAANRSADKIFVGNILRDVDIGHDSVDDLVRKFLVNMSRNGQVPLQWNDVITRFLLNCNNRPKHDKEYMIFDPAAFSYPLESVCLRDWEGQEGRHLGIYFLEELQGILRSRCREAIAGAGTWYRLSLHL